MQLARRTTSALAAVVLTGTAILASPAVASEQDATPGPANTNSSTSVTVDGLESDTIEKADKYVKSSGGSLSFDSKTASSLSQAEKNQVQKAVDEWNGNVRSQESSSKSGGLDAQKGSRVSGKHGYIEGHWWGLKIHVDSYLAGKISGGAATGAFIAGSIGLATAETGVGGVAGSVVAVALSGASAAVGLCAAEDGSVTFYEAISGGAPVCNPLA